jgi:hypothetical protein
MSTARRRTAQPTKLTLDLEMELQGRLWQMKSGPGNLNKPSSGKAVTKESIGADK